MADDILKDINPQQDMKQWQHCSLFNLDLFHDEHEYLNLTKDILLSKSNLENCSCTSIVLQKNYNTALEHVAEKLLFHENKTSKNCSYCSTHDTNENKGQSLNKKILSGSTAILDNFLRNNLRTPLSTHSNSSPSTTTVIDLNPPSRIIAGSSNQRRWHSERTSRHPNVRANLPLTTAQRQVLEHYMHYPLVKPATNTHSRRRSHHHRQPITGKAIENTGTALSAFLNQPLNTISLQKNSAPPIAHRSSSTISHQSSLNRHCFLADTFVHIKSEAGDDDNESVASDVEQSSDADIHELNQSSSSMKTAETLAECLICCESKRLQKRTCCDFFACSSCLSKYVEQQIKQGIIRIQCPNDQCHIYMHRDEIHQRCLTPELRQKLAQFLIDNNRSSNIKTCPRCSNIHEIDAEVCRSMRRAPTKVQCVECNLIWCFQCHSPWHDGIQCREFRRGDRMLKKWAQELHYGQYNAQQCPSCKVYIQRTKGCDHIVCLRCKTEFCYKCGDRFRDIKFIGDHYSELSVLGCKYRFYPDHPLKRRLIRGSILGGKILAAPLVLSLAVVAGTICAGIGLPAYCCFILAREIDKRRKKHRHGRLKEPVLMNYKTPTETVPQLIPRDPVNMKPGFHSIRTAISNNIETDFDPINDAPIAALEDEFISIPINASTSNFPRLNPYSIVKQNEESRP